MTIGSLLITLPSRIRWLWFGFLQEKKIYTNWKTFPDLYFCPVWFASRKYSLSSVLFLPKLAGQFVNAMIYAAFFLRNSLFSLLFYPAVNHGSMVLILWNQRWSQVFSSSAWVQIWLGFQVTQIWGFYDSLQNLEMVLRFQPSKSGEGRWIYCLLFSCTSIKLNEEIIKIIFLLQWLVICLE